MITNLCQFFQFSKACPVCGEPLSFYMSANEVLWRAAPLLLSGPAEYKFQPYKSVPDDLSISEDSFTIIDAGDSYYVKCSSHKIYQKSKTWDIFFFAMCNTRGIEDMAGNDYIINPLQTCYFRSSLLMQMREQPSKNWCLIDNPDAPNTKFMRDEIFTFKVPIDSEKEKVYILNLDYENDRTLMEHLILTFDSSKEIVGESFSKELPALSVRPNFDLDKRDKLIEKFDYWILVS